MKTQAWGWLATAVLAAGLNSNYHNGGLQWLHETADRVEHNTHAVLALATGHADQFLAEAQLVASQSSPSCPVKAALAVVRHTISPVETEQSGFERMTARQEQAMARVEATRARIGVRLARLQMANFNPVVVRVPKVVCPRVRMSMRRMSVASIPGVVVTPQAIRVE